MEKYKKDNMQDRIIQKLIQEYVFLVIKNKVYLTLMKQTPDILNMHQNYLILTLKIGLYVIYHLVLELHMKCHYLLINVY